MSDNISKLLTESEVAEAHGIAVGTLRNWRSNGSVDLPFVRVGGSIRYNPDDVREFIKRNTVTVEPKR